MAAPRVVRELKTDAFGRVELLDGREGRMVRRIACGGSFPGSRRVAHVLLRRECRALGRLEGVAGVASIVDLPGYAAAPSFDGAVPSARDVLVRSWIEGEPLYAASELPADFFARLEDLVRELHDRGVCHNDLHKEPNVLVQADGRPALVDFQLASCHDARGRGFCTRAEEDLRHVAKHRRVYAVGTGVEAIGRLPRRRSLAAAAWMRLGKPVYNLVTRRLLQASDNEPRRPPGGPWPTWGPPVGPGEPAPSGPSSSGRKGLAPTHSALEGWGEARGHAVGSPPEVETRPEQGNEPGSNRVGSSRHGDGPTPLRG